MKRAFLSYVGPVTRWVGDYQFDPPGEDGKPTREIEVSASLAGQMSHPDCQDLGFRVRIEEEKQLRRSRSERKEDGE